MSQVQMISIVSPVYGCRDCLPALVDAVKTKMEETDFDWELVLVDDCGPDHPWSLISELAAEDAHIRGIRLTRNYGQHLAIWAGLEAARGDWVVVIDCDLQDDPAMIPALHAEALAKEVDGVLIERGEWSDTGFRRMASKVFYYLIKLLAGISLNNIGNFGIYSRRMVNILLAYKEQEVFLPLMVTLTGLKTSQMQVNRSDRGDGPCDG